MRKETIVENLNAVGERIVTCCNNCARNPAEITLLAVSKTQPAEAIRSVYEAGQHHFGENYLQEALQKQDRLADLDICWHFIGPLQSNKTRAVAGHFQWVHSVDRLKIAQRLSAQRPHTQSPLNICLQVNIDGEHSKSGVAPQAVAALVQAVVPLPGLRLRGLMAIPAARRDPAQQRRPFAELARLLQALREQFPEQPLDTLSMGMSADMEMAIACGATIVRIGTDIFGVRK
ncbi:YggS family pyridoxal phosphate-dependent enzyme [Microbulbifer sp. 2205BS26-8]|uniref:YggS family pyridoxal phosphate-dependent enzyme n=1 Tax=Microbulbifer sp. 2205BS26-8 TaxID=3064386 RepID=UPI00273D500E|nr:YggS family pyridoxal phosphate-dependent enzyme [Microbulbifer sp. 2205BS26-8]MDP5209637.1 YggS family pyridoxal phosphate-dependent enzyme [Microbulbifer sp. 2205BS26-8]